MYEIEPVGFVRVTVHYATARIRRELDCRAAAVRPPRGSSAGVGFGLLGVLARRRKNHHGVSCLQRQRDPASPSPSIKSPTHPHLVASH